MRDQAFEAPCRAAPETPPCVVVPAERDLRRFVPFFIASLSLTLTLGATLGMISLARLTGTWGPLSRPSVWAHGYVQVFGFLALFVMGFAYHAVPRFVGASLQHASAVPRSLWFQLGGVLGVAAAFLIAPASPLARLLWIVGSAALVGGAVLFARVMIATVRGRSSPPQPFQSWMVAGALWLAAASAVALAAAVADDTTWHHVLWPAALYGFAGSWILGAGRRLFPSSVFWKARWPRLERPAFALYQFGVFAWCVGAWPAEGPARLARGLGAMTLLVTVPLFAAILGLFGERRSSAGGTDRDFRDYVRYMNAAWAWLFVALVTGPGWTFVAIARGGHASITALDLSRHTLALGFASQMIMGMGSRFVPVFCGTWLWSPRAHRLAFWLLNVAVVIRGLQAILAAGYWPEVWPYLALSGPPAVLAIALFATNIFMALRTRRLPLYTRSSFANRPLSALLEVPGALDVLVASGLTPMRRAWVRAMLAKALTLRQACTLMGIAVDPLLAQVTALARGGAAAVAVHPSSSSASAGQVPVGLVRGHAKPKSSAEASGSSPAGSRSESADASDVGEA